MNISLLCYNFIRQTIGFNIVNIDTLDKNRILTITRTRDSSNPNNRNIFTGQQQRELI